MPEAQENPTLFDLVDDPIATDKGSIYDYEASLGEYMSAAGSRAMDTNPVQLMLREGDFLGEDLASIAGKTEWVNADTARKEVTDAQLELKVPDNGISRFELDTLKYLKRREVEQFQTMARRSGPLTSVAGFGAGLAASAADPLNAASAFIPLVPEWRYASWLAKASGFGERAAIRAGVGAVEGGVGAALIEPFVYYGATDQQLDYSLADSFMNVAFGTALGGGLHTIGGSAFDAFNAKTIKALRELDPGLRALGERDAAASAPDSVKMDALHSSVEALERDAAVDVAPVFERNAPSVRVEPAEALSPELTAFDVYDAGGAKVANITGIVENDGKTFHVSNVVGGRPGALGPAQVREILRQLRGHLPDVTELTGHRISGARETNTPPLRIMDTIDELADESGITSDRSALAAWIDERLKTAEAGDVGRLRKARDALLSDANIPTMDLVRVPVGRTPRDLGGLIEQSRADRTQGAFDRQFVDETPADVQASRQADEAVAKSGEDLKTVAEDVQFLDQQIEGLKARELWTKEDDAALAQGDEAAKAFEKEASIYRAAAVCMMEG